MCVYAYVKMHSRMFFYFFYSILIFFLVFPLDYLFSLKTSVFWGSLVINK